jgi:chromosome segregation ATPase
MKKTIYWLISFSAVVLLAAGLTRFGTVAANPQGSEAAMTQALIKEVQELRRTLQDVVVSNARTQLTIEHIRLQKSLVDDLQQDRRTVQERLESDAANLQETEESARQLEKLIGATADPAYRSELEHQLRALQLNGEQTRQRLQRQRAQEAQLNAGLEQEQAKLAELRTTFAALEQAFKRPERNR